MSINDAIDESSEDDAQFALADELEHEIEFNAFNQQTTDNYLDGSGSESSDSEESFKHSAD